MQFEDSSGESDKEIIDNEGVQCSKYILVLFFDDVKIFCLPLLPFGISLLSFCLCLLAAYLNAMHLAPLLTSCKSQY